MHGHMYISYAYAKDKERMKCVGTVIVSIDTAPVYTLHPPVIHTYTRRKPRRRLAILLMIGAFSTRRPAMAFIPGVRLVCHRLLLTGFCPSAVQPLEIRGRSDNTTPTASYTVVSQCLHHALLRRRRSYPRTATLEHSSRGQLSAACLCFAVCGFPGMPEPPP